MKTKKAIYALITVVAAYFMYSCNKLDVTTTEQNTNNVAAIEAKFFTIPAGTSDLTKRVIEEIKRRNEKSGFVAEFAISNGYPVWDKVIQKKRQNQNQNQSSAIANTVGSPNSTDTLLIIPIVNITENRVNGIIRATINNGVALNYSLSQFYKNFGFGSDNVHEQSTKFAFLNMALNKQIFGIDTYNFTDKKLFSNDTAFVKTVFLHFEPNQAPIGNLIGEICYDIEIASWLCTSAYCQGEGGCVCIGGVCPYNDCYYIESEYEYCVDETLNNFPPSPGGASGPQAGTGGTSNIPPYYPCVNAPSGPVPVVSPTAGGGQLPTCPPPGPGTGWNPETPDANGFYQSRINQLASMLSANKFSLTPCDELEKLAQYGLMWQNVASFQIPQLLLQRMDSVTNLFPHNSSQVPINEMCEQTLANADGAVVNCDFFPIRITQLPTGFTAASLLEYFRTHLNQFSNSNTSFNPYGFYYGPTGVSFNDSVRFNAPYQQSTGSLIHINIFPNDGSVMQTSYISSEPPANDHSSYSFIFSTLYSPLDHGHPVSGNRKFGIYNTSTNANEWTFYTMGVDRIEDYLTDRIARRIGLNGADALWQTMQNKMVNFINQNGGQSSFYTEPYIKARPKWQDVEQFLRKEIDMVELKIRMGC
jgi:hypothetical protein